jgi:hypothetical protein
MKITKRKLAVIVSVALVATSVVLQHTYRPFIYQNHINDWHLADTLTSWFAIPAATLFLWGISKDKFLKILVSSLAGLLIYEFIGFIFTIDWLDVIATLLSGGLTYLAYILYRKIRSHRSQPSKIVSS